MKIFFYGGTFDPPHIGHYNIVKHCLNLCEKFIIIPVKQSPLKIVKPEVSDNHRLQMLKILFKVRIFAGVLYIFLKSIFKFE